MTTVTYRFSRRAKSFAHIRCPEGVRSGSSASRVLCGMCDCSAIGEWRETDHSSGIPIHLVICPRCIERAGELGLLEVAGTN
jgi:hypothetical protein